MQDQPEKTATRTQADLERPTRIVTGLGVSVSLGFWTWICFELLTLKMNPEFTGIDYWKAVFDRMQSNIEFSCLFLASLVLTCIVTISTFRLLWKCDITARESRAHP